MKKGTHSPTLLISLGLSSLSLALLVSLVLSSLSPAPLVSLALSSLSPALLACSLVYSLISLSCVVLLPALAPFSLVYVVLPSPSSSPAPFYFSSGRPLPYPLPSPFLPSALTFPSLLLLSTIIHDYYHRQWQRGIHLPSPSSSSQRSSSKCWCGRSSLDLRRRHPLLPAVLSSIW
ncbi:hypothetical protein ACLOJK_008370 [Asimina triloba]